MFVGEGGPGEPLGKGRSGMRAEHGGLGVVLVMVLLAGSATGQEAGGPGAGDSASGSALFYTHCAACHGKRGEGDGPVAKELEFAPPDLTRIASRAGGVFPAELVRRIVDGRHPVKGHGGPEMPIWGDAFRSESEGFDEAAAQARIRSIVDYIETLQKESE